jgi:hypothetical protein
MVADALRRIEPAPLAISGWADENRVFCRIGGEMIPIHPHEVQDLYYQMQFLLKHQVMHEQILKPITVRNSMVANGTVQSDGMGEMLNSFTVIERVS